MENISVFGVLLNNTTLVVIVIISTNTSSRKLAIAARQLFLT
jgi:hypothetical protein